ncbi:MAG: helix-turn-helix domain-containing protein [Bacteroidetes Order II. Incertae sedis bacterium]|jgi:hypothetical protein|nr:helix-turn-helix domain-containing protein [Bacteroidetes Order II. bacterium]
MEMKTDYQLFDQLRESLVSETISLIDKYLTTTGAKPFLTQDDVCELTGWSKRQLAYKRKKGELPFIKRGRTVWYKTSDMLHWFEQGYVPTEPAVKSHV